MKRTTGNIYISYTYMKSWYATVTQYKMLLFKIYISFEMHATCTLKSNRSFFNDMYP